MSKILNGKEKNYKIRNVTKIAKKNLMDQKDVEVHAITYVITNAIKDFILAKIEKCVYQI